MGSLQFRSLGAARESALPDEELRWRVTAVREPGWFRESGMRTRQDFERVLSLTGRSCSDFDPILDFGCGPGRLLLCLRDIASRTHLYGVDIDTEAIAWTREHIPWARTSCNQGMPPLGFAAGTFDLVLSYSVFTHLDREYQDAWLAELRRVLRPGGIAVLSVSGERPLAELERTWREAGADPAPLRRIFREEGILHVREDGWCGGPFPDFYHTTFHAAWYVLEHWSDFFNVRAVVPRGALDFQDLVLVERPR